MTASPRPKPRILTLTDAAASRIRALMAASDRPEAGLRLGVRKGGCAGMEYTMDFVEAPGRFDEVVEDKGARVLVDAAAVLFLLGAEMDYVTDKLSARFTFRNPNETSACGCGESVELKPADPAALAPAE
ncbi:MAG TPA: iron-sulfur cluster assembly accessory protein [Hyphomicrobiales bacterium]|nr:iron-sulfur cluster assembly accessory protein [Hyphomicrobiales bacterium]